VQTITTFRNPLADPLGTRRGPPLVRGPQFENRCITTMDTMISLNVRKPPPLVKQFMDIIHSLFAIPHTIKNVLQ